MRGEYLRRMYHHFITIGSPLLARGVPKINNYTKGNCRITPACAGSTFNTVNIFNVIKDHPCLRGEYFLIFHLSLHMLGSPLLARGVLVLVDLQMILYRITPACAGSTRIIFSTFLNPQDHPCLRGEYVPLLFVL